MDLIHDSSQASALRASAAYPPGTAAAVAVTSTGLIEHRDKPQTAPTSLSRAYRVRPWLLGLAMALCAVAAGTAGGLAIVAGLFHTSLGSIA